MNAHVDVGPVWSRLWPVPTDVGAALQSLFTVPVKNAYFARRARPGWDGMVRFFGGDGRFYTGLLPKVVDVLEEVGYGVKFTDGRLPPRRQEFGTATVTLYPYQEAILAGAIPAARGTVYAATNSGKTEIAVALTQRLGVRTLFLVPTADLATQTAARYRAELPEARVACLTGAAPVDFNADVVVANVQALAHRVRAKPTGQVSIPHQAGGWGGRRKKRWLGPITRDGGKFLRSFDLLFADECFIAGTPVDTSEGPVSIEKIQPGDIVFGAAGPAIVGAVIQKTAHTLVRVSFTNGVTVTCTPSHKFFTVNGWTRADALEVDSEIILRSEAEAIFKGPDEEVPAVPEDVRGPNSGVHRTPALSRHALWEILRNEMASPSTGLQGAPHRGKHAGGCVSQDAAGDGRQAVRAVWKNVLRPADDAGAPAPVLRSTLRDREHRQETGSPTPSQRADEGEQPIEEAGRHATRSGDTQGARKLHVGPRVAVAGRERNGTDTGRAADVRALPGGESRVLDRAREDVDAGVSARVQGGPRVPGREGRRRARRRLSHLPRCRSSRREEDGLSGTARVDRVEVLELGRLQADGRRREPTVVYDLSIDGHPSYSVGGLLVHNCHLLTSREWAKLVRECTAYYRFALSATPETGDVERDMLLVGLFGETVGSVSQKFLVGERRSAQLTVRFLRYAPARKLSTHAWSEQYEAGVVLSPERNAAIAAAAAVDAQSGLRVMILVERYAHAAALGRLLTARRVGWHFMSGQNKADRTRMLTDFKSGRVPVAMATRIFNQGIDVREMDRLFIAAAGRSATATIQRAGRLTRGREDKLEATLYDCYDVGVYAPSVQPRKRFLEQHYRARLSAYRGEGFLIDEGGKKHAAAPGNGNP